MKRLVLAAVLLITTSTSFAVAQNADLISQGDKLWGEQKIDEAEKIYQQAIKASPDDAIAYEKLAGLYLTNSRTKDAIGIYQDAINRNPENAKSFVGLSLAYLHQQKYSQASAMAAQARILDPNLKQADKLIEYISKKEEFIAMTQKADESLKSDKHKIPAAHSTKKMHGKEYPEINK